MINLSLKWPPSANMYWRRNGYRYFISPKGIQYRQHVLSTVYGLYTPFKGPVSIAILAYPPDKRRRDLDNLLKGLLDSLQYAGIFPDDNQVARLLIERCSIEAPGRLDIKIEEINHG